LEAKVHLASRADAKREAHCKERSTNLSLLCFPQIENYIDRSNYRICHAPPEESGGGCKTCLGHVTETACKWGLERQNEARRDL